MKKEELLGVLQNEELSLEDKISKIQALNGLDRQSEIDKLEALKQQHEQEKLNWQNEQEKFKNYVSQETHQSILDELNGYKQKEENVRRTNFIKGLGAQDKYSDLILSQIDWSKAEYDGESYKGDDFLNAVNTFKEKYNDLFVQPKQQEPIVEDKGYFGSKPIVQDLTKL